MGLHLVSGYALYLNFAPILALNFIPSVLNFYLWMKLSILKKQILGVDFNEQENKLVFMIFNGKEILKEEIDQKSISINTFQESEKEIMKYYYIELFLNFESKKGNKHTDMQLILSKNEKFSNFVDFKNIFKILPKD